MCTVNRVCCIATNSEVTEREAKEMPPEWMRSVARAAAFGGIVRQWTEPKTE